MNLVVEEDSLDFFLLGYLLFEVYRCLDQCIQAAKSLDTKLTKCPCLHAMWRAVLPEPCSLDLIKSLSELKNATCLTQNH